VTATSSVKAGKAPLWPHVACGAFIVLWLDVGVATSFMTALPATVKVGVLGIWMVIAAARSMPFLGALSTNAWPLALMLVVSVLYGSELAQSDQYVQGFGYMLMAFSLCCFYAQGAFRRERNVVMWVMLTDFVITGARTLIALQTDPLVSRYLATTEENRVKVYGQRSFAGLGGYGYAYSLAAILIVLMYFAAKSSRRLLLTCVIAVGFLTLVEMAFTTAIVLVLTLGAVFLVHDKVRPQGVRIILYAAALIGWASGLYSALLESLAGASWVSADVQTRLDELARFLSGESTTGGDLGTRVDRWTHSLGLFLSSGVFGLAGTGGSGQDTGGHSQWLDLLASYGIWAGLLVLFLVLTWRMRRAWMSPNGAEALGRAWVYFLVLGVVNTLLFSTIVLTWMFLLPALAEWLADRARVTNQVSRVEVPA
jgi:hypothetical protein